MLHLVYTLHNVWQIRGMQTDWLTDWLTNQPTPWFTVLIKMLAASASQHIPCILCNLRVHFFVYKSHSLVHALPSYFFKIHFNIILPSTFRPSKLSLYFKFPNQNPVSRISLTCVPHASTPSSLIFSPYQQHTTSCIVSIITLNGIWVWHAVNIIYLLFWITADHHCLYIDLYHEHRNHPWKASIRMHIKYQSAWQHGTLDFISKF
jgi:hypothetical protein